MTVRTLVIGSSGPLDTSTFAWRSTSGESSFHTTLDPELRAIGDVPEPHRDLASVAIGVFMADRTIPRPASWHRSIELEVPVYDVDRWADVSSDLSATLGMLSSDSWQLSFEPRATSPSTPPSRRPAVDRALLFSGGADSLCGAIRALSQGDRLLLVAHWDWAGHSSVQRELARELAKRFPDQVYLRQVRLGRRETQVGGQGVFRNEPTRRTRSLLFLALGLAHAAVEPAVPLWIAENGYAALNPPLAGERRGALSTRTTHPLVLDRLRQAILSVGGVADFSNPFSELTKGEMYAQAAELLGSNDAAKLLSTSHSCAHVRFAIGTGYPPGTQCGVCFGCLVRRAAFIAAGLSDATTYLHKSIPTKHQPPHLRETARREVGTIRYAAARGVKAADLLSMGLPASFPFERALAVAQRGLDEFAQVVDIEPDLKKLA